MTVSVIAPNEAIHRTARSLGIQSATASAALNSELIAHALRRAVHILAPCEKNELESAVLQSLAGLGSANDELALAEEAILEELIVYGDILEMRRADDDPWNRSGLVLRPAPPSFVIRTDRSIAVLGVAGDEITPFTGELAGRLRHTGALRIIYPEEGEDLKALFAETGLLELSERVWLRIPKLESAASHISEWRQALATEPTSNSVKGMRILDSSRPPTFYSGRWVEPNGNHQGIYVARRPQLYGNDLWCLIELEKGVVQKFKDLVSPGDRIRPCDIAWRIQMAIDAESGVPPTISNSRRAGKFVPGGFFFTPAVLGGAAASYCRKQGEGAGLLVLVRVFNRCVQRRNRLFAKRAMASWEQGLGGNG